VGLHEPEPFLTVASGVDLEPLGLQTAPDEVHDPLLVIDHEDASG
jgi:hypothetical protein